MFYEYCSWFVGAMAYADDIVLLAPTATAVRRMLAVCDEFAVHDLYRSTSCCISHGGSQWERAISDPQLRDP